MDIDRRRAALRLLGTTVGLAASVQAPWLSAQPRAASGRGALYDIAGTLSKGEWRKVPTELPPGFSSFRAFQLVTKRDAGGGRQGGVDGMGWTGRLIEHQGALLPPPLMRSKFDMAQIGIGADLKAWRREQPPGLHVGFGERRPFDRWTDDGQYAYFFAVNFADAAGNPDTSRPHTGRWVRTPLAQPGVFEAGGVPVPGIVSGNFAALIVKEWGHRRFIYSPGGHVDSIGPNETTWREHWKSIPKDARGSGYAGVMVFNPKRQELLCIGGQKFGNNPDISDRVTIIRSPDAQGVVASASIGGEKLHGVTAADFRIIVHPVTGEYVSIHERAMYRSADGLKWTPYHEFPVMTGPDGKPLPGPGSPKDGSAPEPRRDYPWGRWEPYIAWTVLPGTDVAVCVSHIAGVLLHRFKA